MAVQCKILGGMSAKMIRWVEKLHVKHAKLEVETKQQSVIKP